MRCGIRAWILVLALVGVMSGCAASGGHPQDPFEPFNRTVFRFNETVDEAVLQPVARGYRAVLPELVRTGVSNFFSNLEDIWIAANNFLQGKPVQGVEDVARFVFNSTIGLLGVLDVSTDFNLPKHNEDFGQTLGRWGADTGPYVVLPFFGPSNVRDAVGFVVDFKADLVSSIDHIATRNALFALRTVNIRANLLDIGRVAEEAALDKYRFTRDANFQRRRNLVYDGEPPREIEKTDLPQIDEGIASESPRPIEGVPIEGVVAPNVLVVQQVNDREIEHVAN
jgi:phospholipid-binding lipoprotein MlaA